MRGFLLLLLLCVLAGCSDSVQIKAQGQTGIGVSVHN